MNPPISQLYPLQVNLLLPDHAIPRPPSYTYANPNAQGSSISLPSFREFCIGLQLPYDSYNKPIDAGPQPSIYQGAFYSQHVYPPQNYQPQNYTVHSRGPSISSLEGSPEQTLIQLRYSGDSRRLLAAKSESSVKIPKKRGRKKKANTICTQCRLENTPEWRKGPEGSRTLCNACGLFYLKLTRKFGTRQAGTIMKVKKSRNEIYDRLVPSDEQRDEMCGLAPF